tara:strand:+ start:4815 stop:5510 length:696 start_codon:yes stop_codon:yes gene_type:complete
MAKFTPEKMSKLMQMIKSGKNQPMWSGGRRGGRGPENVKNYSQAEIDEMNRVNQQASEMAYDIDGMNNLKDGTFLDTFPRYQENFQFTNGIPSNFRVKRDLGGYRSDAAMNYPDGDIVKHNKPDVARMNMYGNGDFMNTDGLISPNKINGGQPEYIMGNEFPKDDYIMDPKMKIRKAIESGNLGASENADGQLAGRRDWYENKPTNTNELYLDQPDNWDEYLDPLEDNWDK